ncbi:MAG: hemolysin III family protein [Gemmatimonadota bacterium]|nr:hemolysin III family protein [Gemmatimonadota bacterium]
MRVREPVNAWSHLVGLILAALGTALLLRLADGFTETAAFAVYGGSLILLYAASTIYHALPLPAHRLRPLRTLDHVAIYFLIAGTYTPVALVTLPGPWGWALLGTAWAIAAAGIPFKIWWIDAPVWLSTGIYLAMGYMALLAAAPLAAAVPAGGLVWLVAGGLAYTAGAIIFTRRRPDPFPGRFGHHEIWHVMVLVGSGCHFAFMLFHVAPA